MKFYTGIGSRETPKAILAEMTKIATLLSARDYILRSGGAPGADSAFEAGSTNSRIYLPWEGFSNKYIDDNTYIVPPKRYDFVEDYHPKPLSLSVKGWKFMSRNSYQVLGDDLDNPVLSEFVLCYTADGKASGGTGQALRIAKDYGVEIFNFFFDEHIKMLYSKFN